jgi:hypothetical protein
MGLRAYANVTLDSPIQVDLLFHIDICDLLAAVATIPPRWCESRHGTACDRRLWAVACSGHHHPLFGRRAGRVASQDHCVVAIGAAQMINPRLRMFPGGSLRVRVGIGIGDVRPRNLPAAAAASSAAAT